ncbi:MAG: SPASM domain-containing protein [Magnetococcales bacterium]|nr:SPASM domain-containing protein [Magnetococcales bacterium]
MKIRSLFRTLVTPPTTTPAPSATAPIEEILTSLASTSSGAYQQELFKGLDETAPMPSRMYGIEINDSCNIDCAMCLTSSSKRTKGLMDMALFEEAVIAVKQSGMRATNLHTVGEPLANKKLPQYLEILKKHNLPINSLSTNGLLLERNMETLFTYRDLIGRIRFSIDGASKEVYEKIRLGGKWEALHHNLTQFMARNEQAENPFRIEVSSVISVDNFHEIAFIPTLFSYVAKPTAFTFYWINSLSPQNDYFFQQSYFGSDYQLKVPCNMLWNNMYVLKDGSLTACCRDYQGDLVFSKIGAEPLAEVFNNPAIQSLRRTHLKGKKKKLPQSCQDCFGVDPRLSTLINALFVYYNGVLKRHPVHLQNLLNKIGPLLKNKEYQAIWPLIPGLNQGGRK